jgi:TolA-binding protein
MTEFEEKISTKDTDISGDESITPQPEETTTPLPESRTRRVLRNIIRWTISLLIAFGLGALVVYFAYLVPTQRSLDKNTAELDLLTQQVDTLTDKLEQMTQDNQELEGELINKQVNVILLRAISNVRAANLAVSNDDYAGALLSMRDAAQALESLDESIGEDQGEVITALQDSLSEIEDMIKSDPEAAKMNLDRLITNLIKLEKTIIK